MFGQSARWNDDSPGTLRKSQLSTTFGHSNNVLANQNHVHGRYQPKVIHRQNRRPSDATSFGTTRRDVHRTLTRSVVRDGVVLAPPFGTFENDALAGAGPGAYYRSPEYGKPGINNPWIKQSYNALLNGRWEKNTDSWLRATKVKIAPSSPLYTSHRHNDVSMRPQSARSTSASRNRSGQISAASARQTSRTLFQDNPELSSSMHQPASPVSARASGLASRSISRMGRTSTKSHPRSASVSSRRRSLARNSLQSIIQTPSRSRHEAPVDLVQLYGKSSKTSGMKGRGTSIHEFGEESLHNRGLNQFDLAESRTAMTPLARESSATRQSNASNDQTTYKNGTDNNQETSTSTRVLDDNASITERTAMSTNLAGAASNANFSGNTNHSKRIDIYITSTTNPSNVTTDMDTVEPISSFTEAHVSYGHEIQQSSDKQFCYPESTCTTASERPMYQVDISDLVATDKASSVNNFGENVPRQQVDNNKTAISESPYKSENSVASHNTTPADNKPQHRSIGALEQASTDYEEVDSKMLQPTENESDFTEKRSKYSETNLAQSPQDENNSAENVSNVSSYGVISPQVSSIAQYRNANGTPMSYAQVVAHHDTPSSMSGQENHNLENSNQQSYIISKSNDTCTTFKYDSSGLQPSDTSTLGNEIYTSSGSNIVDVSISSFTGPSDSFHVQVDVDCDDKSGNCISMESTNCAEAYSTVECDSLVEPQDNHINPKRSSNPNSCVTMQNSKHARVQPTETYLSNTTTFTANRNTGETRQDTSQDTSSPTTNTNPATSSGLVAPSHRAQWIDDVSAPHASSNDVVAEELPVADTDKATSDCPVSKRTNDNSNTTLTSSQTFNTDTFNTVCASAVSQNTTNSTVDQSFQTTKQTNAATTTSPQITLTEESRTSPKATNVRLFPFQRSASMDSRTSVEKESEMNPSASVVTTSDTPHSLTFSFTSQASSSSNAISDLMYEDNYVTLESQLLRPFGKKSSQNMDDTSQTNAVPSTNSLQTVSAPSVGIAYINEPHDINTSLLAKTNIASSDNSFDCTSSMTDTVITSSNEKDISATISINDKQEINDQVAKKNENCTLTSVGGITAPMPTHTIESQNNVSDGHINNVSSSDATNTTNLSDLKNPRSASMGSGSDQTANAKDVDRGIQPPKFPSHTMLPSTRDRSVSVGAKRSNRVSEIDMGMTDTSSVPETELRRSKLASAADTAINTSTANVGIKANNSNIGQNEASNDTTSTKLSRDDLIEDRIQKALAIARKSSRK